MKVKNKYLNILEYLHFFFFEKKKKKKKEYLHLSFIKWPSIQYKLRVSLVLWNHNNGEDCWVGNDPEDDHWHPPQRG